jgi:hypothetical protein
LQAVSIITEVPSAVTSSWITKVEGTDGAIGPNDGLSACKNIGRGEIDRASNTEARYRVARPVGSGAP